MDEHVKKQIRKAFDYHMVKGKEILDSDDIMHNMAGYFMALYDMEHITGEEYKKANFDLFRWSVIKLIEEKFGEDEE